MDKIKRIMQELSLTTADRAVVAPALAKSESSGVAAAAIQLPDGPIVTGKASNLMSACSSCVLNAIKAIAGIDDSLTLISPIILEPILKLKIDILGSRSSVLKVDDVLAALCHHSRHQHADGPRHGRAAEAAGLRDAQHLHAAFR